jgi:hypothetical protein
MSLGIIYFIQPAELVGTNRYKIGCSKNPNLDRCKKGYKKNTRFICIMECNNPIELERKIKNEFNNKFKLFCGNEYFCGEEKNMLKEFMEIAYSHKNSIKLLDNISKVKLNNSTQNIFTHDSNNSNQNNILWKEFKDSYIKTYGSKNIPTKNDFIKYMLN